MACERRYDAGPFGKRCHTNRLYQPHGDVTPAILPKAPRFGVCCICVEYPTRNIAERLALTQRPSAMFRVGYSTDRKSTRLNSSHQIISYAVFCLKKKKTYICINAHTSLSPALPHNRS